MKIIDHVFVVPGLVANPYLIVDEDGLTVIDAGLPRREKKIRAYVTSLGKRAEEHAPMRAGSKRMRLRGASLPARSTLQASRFAACSLR